MNDTESPEAKLRMAGVVEAPLDSPPISPALGVSAAALAAMRFPEVKYVVPRYIPEGLTLFAGKPKIGKSWLALHAAIAAASRGSTLGERCEEDDVLYCALEDNLRRVQGRMTKVMGAFATWPERLTFICEMPRLNVGGLEYIRRWIARSAKPRLCIIDTLARVRDRKPRDQVTYDADYQSMVALKAIADEFNLAIVVIHHVRKMDADDPIDTVSGTTGLTAVVDTILVLLRSTQGTVLYGRGRDTEEFEKAANFDRETCLWRITGNASDIRRSETRNAILRALANGSEPLRAKEIADLTGLTDGNVRKMLMKMAQEGEEERADYGRYRAARP
jgi:RecA-family ATPase